MPSYVFDLVKLRERYGISIENTPSVEPEVEVVDCEADVAAWETRAEEAEVKAAIAGACAWTDFISS